MKQQVSSVTLLQATRNDSFWQQREGEQQQSLRVCVRTCTTDKEAQQEIPSAAKSWIHQF